MANLLTAARVPKDEQVEVVKVQLTDMAWTWWLVEGERLEPPIAWEQFMDNFYERLFPKGKWSSSPSTCNRRVKALMSTL